MKIPASTRSLLAAAVLAACAGAPPLPDPPPTAVETRPLRGTDRYRVAAEGLEPAVAVEGVKERQLALARRVVEAAIRALPAGGAPRPGQVLDLRLGPATSRVKLVSTAGSSLLVVDVPPAGSRVLPVKALATAAVAEAHAAHAAGRDPEARRLLEESLALTAGDPLAAPPGDDVPAASNHENYLAHALLARMSDGAEAERHYVDALARSPRYLASELGGSPAALQEPDRAALLELAGRIAARNLDGTPEPRRIGGAVRALSPIWEPGGGRQEAILPPQFLGLYYEAPGADALRDPSHRLLAVRAFERLRDDPVALLLATREIRSLYLAEPLVPSAAEPQDAPEVKMLSALLADVARKAAAGLGQSEIDATLDGDATPETLASARAKLRLQRDRESSWYAGALSGR